MPKKILCIVFAILILPCTLFASAGGSLPESSAPWWLWSLMLFSLCLFLGIAAVVAGVGGGILYLPIVGALFPFHTDFIRGSGLLVALVGALSAAPRLLKSGTASLRLALPLALASSMGALAGAQIGLAVPARTVELSLGIAIVGIVTLMIAAKGADHPNISKPGALSVKMGIRGSYRDKALGEDVRWNIHRFIPGCLLFVLIGFLSGMFGMGAGWANVPALNLLLGAPLKVSVATSILIIAINGATASWVYLNQGAVIPLIAIPSAAGMMVGTRIGARLLPKVKPKAIRWVVITFLVLAGLRQILSGLGILS